MSTREEGLKVQGLRLAAWRAQQVGNDGKPLSQKEAAKKVNASQGAWAAWEKGRKAPDPNMAYAIEDLTEREVSARGWAFPRSSSLVAKAAEIAKAS